MKTQTVMCYMKPLLFAIFGLFISNPFVYAENVEDWMPDEVLREAVRETLALPAPVPLTKQNIIWLTSLDATDKGITNISGLEFALNLTNFDLGGNHIQDISPLQHLSKLSHISLFGNQISDLSSLIELRALVGLNLGLNQIRDVSLLAALVNLEHLDLCCNQIADISPLAGLKNLKFLVLAHNSISDLSPVTGLTILEHLNLQACQITDVSPLKTLTHLRELILRDNPIGDFSPLSGLNLTRFEYDATCEVDPLTPSVEKIQNRAFPSVALWPHRGSLEKVSRYDYIWAPEFPLKARGNGLSIFISGNLETSEILHRQLRERNPDLLFFYPARMSYGDGTEFPIDSDVYLRDENGEQVFGYGGGGEWKEYLFDITNPSAQEKLVEKYVKIAGCGLYDGLAFDEHIGWAWRHLDPATDSEIIAAKIRILQQIREHTRDNFLIVINGSSIENVGALVEYVNGSANEMPEPTSIGYSYKTLQDTEAALLHFEKKMRTPQLNWSEVKLIPSQAPDSPDNIRWMRLFTARSLTFSDGYTSVQHKPSHLANKVEIWYDFWDADLGRPIGGNETKGVLYKTPRGVKIDGLFIREFTNGWAVYNRSGKERSIYLPEKATGWHSKVNAHWHTIPDLDGEMYLKEVREQQRFLQPEDINRDGVVNILDLVIVSNALGGTSPDLNRDGVVNVLDLVRVANAF